ncbi:MAG: hypothetical protein Q6373_010015 [Candidatus Sigynarchaeota archaeon]
MDAEFFSGDVYPSLQDVFRKLDPLDALLMDRVLVTRLSLPPGTQILAESCADIEENYGKIKRGRVFVLPDRIIASGDKRVAERGYVALGAGGVGFARNLSI